MSTYKLIQDIEAEDHILGPLSLRQFIFALIAAFCYYLCFIAVAKHVLFLLVIFVPPAAFFTFFAVPFGRDQPTEVWALAKLRFFLKPRRRIWDQSGVKELVTITAPKKVERVLTKGLSQNEVESRLKALANTLDSRGWAIKNVNLNAYSPAAVAVGGSDRLIDIGAAPQEVPNYDVQASDDILDAASNPVAQQFQNMITESSQAHRQQLMDELNGIRASQQQASQQQWFINRPAAAAANPPASAALPAPALPVSSAGAIPAAAPAATPFTIGTPDNTYAHMRTLRPMSAGSQTPPAPPPQPADDQTATTGTPPSDPAILSLASNNDLNVSTLAREAYKAKHGDEPPQDEVVISLH